MATLSKTESDVVVQTKVGGADKAIFSKFAYDCKSMIN